MSSMREQALAALFTAISNGVPGHARRVDGNSEVVPGRGALVTMEDGSLDAEPIMSPLQYDITHSVPITVEAEERADIDVALIGMATSIAADPFLGGVVDWAELGSPDVEADAPTGPGGQQLPRIYTAQATVTLTYTAPTAVG